MGGRRGRAGSVVPLWKAKPTSSNTTLSATLRSKPKTYKKSSLVPAGSYGLEQFPQLENSSPLLLPYSWKGGECVTSYTPGPAIPSQWDPQQWGWAHRKSLRHYSLAVCCTACPSWRPTHPHLTVVLRVFWWCLRIGLDPEAISRTSLGTGQQVDESTSWRWDLPCLPAVSRSHWESSCPGAVNRCPLWTRWHQSVTVLHHSSTGILRTRHSVASVQLPHKLKLPLSLPLRKVNSRVRE